jgi:hypothetical protein
VKEKLVLLFSFDEKACMKHKVYIALMVVEGELSSIMDQYALVFGLI